MNSVFNLGADALMVAAKQIPHVGSVISAIRSIVDSFTEKNWKNTLIKNIPDVARREIIRNELTSIEAKMKTIDKNVAWLDEPDFQPNSKVAMVHVIHNALDEIVNVFALEDATFREYPHLAVSPLFTIASLMAIYINIEKEVPALAERSTVSCKFLDTLMEYRSLVITGRINQLEIERVKETRVFTHGIEYAVREKASPLALLLNIPNRPYNEPSSIACRMMCDFHSNRGMCMTDTLSGMTYQSRDDDYEKFGIKYDECTSNYVEILKSRIERLFAVPVALASTSCTDRKRQQRKPTGKGWWRATIKTAMATDCDTLNECDLFVRIFVNDNKVYESSTCSNRNYVHVYETYKSMKIRKGSIIRIELWDWDVFLNFDDDLMYKHEAKIDWWLVNGNVGTDQMGFDIESSWKEEYEHE